MSSTLTFQYPAWFLILCILLGLIYAVILYYKSGHFKDPSPSLQRIVLALAILRFFLVSIISFLLLSPIIRTAFSQIEKPVIVFLQDNSKSLSHYFRKVDSTDYLKEVDAFCKSMGDQFDVATYTFGSGLNKNEDFTFDEKATNINNALEKLGDIYYGQNLGAVILASDGIYNEGINPIYARNKLIAPVFTLALGDTMVHKDQLLKNVKYNHIAYLDDQFLFKIDIAASNYKGNTARLTISKKNTENREKLIVEKQIPIQKNNFNHTVPVILEADDAGMQHYVVKLTPLDDELTLINNYEDVFVEVIDGRKKILILANSPHPDLSALKQSIESNDKYEIDIFLAGNIKPKAINEYNLAILHQLPSRTNNINAFLDIIKKEQIPVLYILGSQTYPPFFNKMQATIQLINNSKKNSNEVQAVFNNDFTLFSISELAKKKIEQFPPLHSIFGEYKKAPNTQSLLYQKIGAVTATYPLLAFNQGIDTRTGVLCGEGIWEWRLYDYQQHQNHLISDELINKIVQYLSVKRDKRQFRVMMQKNDLNENETVLFDAELYDDAYELTNTPDIGLKITNTKGEEFPFVFTKTDNAYTLDAGFFPVGNYSYYSEVGFNNKLLTYKGDFSISPLRLEIINTKADHLLLKMLSEKYGANMYFPENMDELVTKINERKDVKPIVNFEFIDNSVINLKWLCLLLLLLMSVEWFTRKYHGSY